MYAQLLFWCKAEKYENVLDEWIYLPVSWKSDSFFSFHLFLLLHIKQLWFGL